MHERKFPEFPHCAVWKNQRFTLTKKYFVNSTLFILGRVAFTKFLPKFVTVEKIGNSYLALLKKYSLKMIIRIFSQNFWWKSKFLKFPHCASMMLFQRWRIQGQHNWFYWSEKETFGWWRREQNTVRRSFMQEQSRAKKSTTTYLVKYYYYYS